MATLTDTPSGLGKGLDYWVDVEVPYGKIVDKWDRKYRQRMAKHIKNGRLQTKVFQIYFNILGIDDFPNDRVEALSDLESRNQEVAYNLCCQFEFSTGISADIIEEHARNNKSKIVSKGFEDEYDKNIGKDDHKLNKDGLVALCQLTNPDSLRNILVRHTAADRYPTGTYKRGSGGVPDVAEWEDLVENMSADTVENYAIWYEFEYDDETFIAIEEEDRDRVERQVVGNIEEEPANLVILHFHGEYLDIYSDKRSTAASAQIGVNTDVDGENYDEERNVVSPGEVGEFADEATENDRERQMDRKDLEYVLYGIEVERTGLTNNPKLKLTSEAGVGTAISELEGEGFNIISDGGKINLLKFEFEGSKFTVRQDKKRSTSGGEYRELIYGTAADASTREQFEAMLEDEFNIEVKYQATSS